MLRYRLLYGGVDNDFVSARVVQGPISASIRTAPPKIHMEVFLLA